MNETFRDRTAGAACNAWVIVRGVTSLKINGFEISIDDKLLAFGNEGKWSMLPPKHRKPCNESLGRRVKCVEGSVKSSKKRRV